MRCFTLGFTLGLAAILWSSSGAALVMSLVVPLFLLLSLRFGRALRLVLCGLSFGFLLAQLSLHDQLSRQFPTDAVQSDFMLIGTIIDAPKVDARRVSFMFRVDQYVGQKPSSSPHLIKLSWYGAEQQALRAGDQWQLQAKLKPPTSLGNPGGFNYSRWLFQRRIHATGYVRDSPSPHRLNSQSFQLGSIRQLIAEHIQLLPAANEFAGLVQGLTVGMTNSIASEQWQTLRLSGTAHLLAISGLHIGLVSGWFYLVSAGLWRLISRVSGGRSHRCCTKTFFCISLSCIAAGLYAALAGFSLPTMRALIMLAVFAVSVIWIR